MPNLKPNCTYNNPKRPAYHEAGHLVALFLLTGGLSGIRNEQRKGTPKKTEGQGSVFNTLEEHRQIFSEVCYGVAGGVAEHVHCHLRGLPSNTMADDIDLLLTYSKQDWLFPFKQKKNGYLGCPLLDNMLKSAEDVITSLFRSYDTILQVRAVADFLILKNLITQNVLNDLQNDTRTKNQLLKILNSTNN